MSSRETRRATLGHIMVQAALGVAAVALVGWGATTSIRSMYPGSSSSAASSTTSSGSSVSIASVVTGAATSKRPGDGGDSSTSGSDSGETQTRNSVTILSAVGFSPDLLAVIGVTPSELAAILAQGNETATADIATLRTQTTAASTAARNLAAKERELRLAGDDSARSTIRTQIAALREQHAVAQSQLATTTSELRSRYVGMLQGDEQERLQAVSTKPNMQVPVYYAAVSRSEADWVRLRDALSVQSRAARKHVDLDARTSEYLERVNADQAVQAAKTRWEANAEQLRGMWR